MICVKLSEQSKNEIKWKKQKTRQEKERKEKKRKEKKRKQRNWKEKKKKEKKTYRREDRGSSRKMTNTTTSNHKNNVLFISSFNGVHPKPCWIGPILRGKNAQGSHRQCTGQGLVVNLLKEREKDQKQSKKQARQKTSSQSQPTGRWCESWKNWRCCGVVEDRGVMKLDAVNTVVCGVVEERGCGVECGS